MTKVKNTVKFKGNPLMLVGSRLSVGEKAPDFEAIANDLSPFKLSEIKGKVLVICSVHSLDTSVCDTEVRKFNERATSLGNDVYVLVISMDLPFAQKRWCGAAGVKNVQTLSRPQAGKFRQLLRRFDKRAATSGSGRVCCGQKGCDSLHTGR